VVEDLQLLQAPHCDDANTMETANWWLRFGCISTKNKTPPRTTQRNNVSNRNIISMAASKMTSKDGFFLEAKLLNYL